MPVRRARTSSSTRLMLNSDSAPMIVWSRTQLDAGRVGQDPVTPDGAREEHQGRERDDELGTMTLM